MEIKEIGAFFTPLEWAKWLLEEFNIFESWQKGAVICDPTAGEGAFLEAFIALAREKDVTVSQKMLKRLYGIEKESAFTYRFFGKLEKKYDIKFPAENIVNADIILSNPGIKADILAGNPPWMNFNDIPAPYKNAVKPYFIEYGLVENPRKLLLGGSRVDIAALILAIVMNDNLKKNGHAYFFVPLSLFLNDGAHCGFRRFSLKESSFAVKEIYDFKDYSVFSEVSTRYGVAHFVRDDANSFPVNYMTKNKDSWDKCCAAPVNGDTSPFFIFQKGEYIGGTKTPPLIEISGESAPRQGVNTCGANDVFIFEAGNIPAGIPENFIYPLVSKVNFLHRSHAPEKFVLLPYNRNTGRPLSEGEIKRHPGLKKYLQKHRKALSGRKGALIGSWIKRGFWWAMLGIGPYSFAPYKIIWNAYGQKTFAARIFSHYRRKPWQANQSLQAFMPFDSVRRAEKVLSKLNDPRIEEYLLSFRMEGTCNWAQPGKMRRLFNFIERTSLC